MHTLPMSWARFRACLTPTAALVIVVACTSVTSVQRAVVSNDVVAALRAHGEAAVMISLTEPTGIDATVERARWQAEIARLQQSVLSRIGPEDFESRTLFLSVPAIAGTVRTERGLAILADHPNVRRVDLDEGGSGTSVR